MLHINKLPKALALAGVSVFLLCLLVPGPTAAQPFAYVANRSDNTVSVIETGTNTVVATVPVGNSLALVPLATFAFDATGSVPSAGRIFFTAGGQEAFSNDPGSIQVVNTDGTGLTTLINLALGTRPQGIALDVQNGHFFWNDWNQEKTFRADLNGSNVTTIQVWPNCGLVHLALDVAGNRIYSTSGACFRNVSRFNLDGSGSFQVLAFPFFGHGIALDLPSGHVYYGDPGTGGFSPFNTGIRRMNLDGTGNVQLINISAFPATNGCGGGDPRHGRGRGMALDLAAGKMYFAGHPLARANINCPSPLFPLGEIWRADLSGANLKLLVSGLQKPTDVALDLGAGKVYWTDARAGKIQRANLDGSNVEDVLTGVLSPDALALEPVRVIEVDIDIKPGSDPNSINCNDDKGTIAVAILTTDDFDAPTVDHTTVRFGKTGTEAAETHTNRRTGQPRRHEEDVDDDSDTDLVFHFRFGDTGLTCDDEEAILTGETFGGQPIEGSDAINPVGGGANKALALEDEAAVPESHALYQNYPNPFNPTTEIRFDLPAPAAVQLVVYDVMGREVARLVDGALPAGQHRARWDASGLPSGTYLYRLTAGAFTETKATTLLK